MIIDIDLLAAGVQQELAELETRRLKLLGKLELLTVMREQALAAQQPSQQEITHAQPPAPDSEPAAQSDQPAEQCEQPADPAA